MANSKPALLSYEDPGFINSPDGRMLRIMAEYVKPLAHFRRERIRDTVVFFGSARFNSLDEASRSLELLDAPGSAKSAAIGEQPASPEELASADVSQLRRAHAEAAVEMAQYYEDARRLAYL